MQFPALSLIITNNFSVPSIHLGKETARCQGVTTPIKLHTVQVNCCQVVHGPVSSNKQPPRFKSTLSDIDSKGNLCGYPARLVLSCQSWDWLAWSHSMTWSETKLNLSYLLLCQPTSVEVSVMSTSLSTNQCLKYLNPVI